MSDNGYSSQYENNFVPLVQYNWLCISSPKEELADNMFVTKPSVNRLVKEFNDSSGRASRWNNEPAFKWFVRCFRCAYEISEGGEEPFGIVMFFIDDKVSKPTPFILRGFRNDGRFKSKYISNKFATAYSFIENACYEQMDLAKSQIMEMLHEACGEEYSTKYFEIQRHLKSTPEKQEDGSYTYDSDVHSVGSADGSIYLPTELGVTFENGDVEFTDLMVENPFENLADCIYIARECTKRLDKFDNSPQGDLCFQFGERPFDWFCRCFKNAYEIVFHDASGTLEYGEYRMAALAFFIDGEVDNPRLFVVAARADGKEGYSEFYGRRLYLAEEFFARQLYLEFGLNVTQALDMICYVTGTRHMSIYRALHHEYTKLAPQNSEPQSVTQRHESEDEVVEQEISIDVVQDNQGETENYQSYFSESFAQATLLNDTAEGFSSSSTMAKQTNALAFEPWLSASQITDKVLGRMRKFLDPLDVAVANPVQYVRITVYMALTQKAYSTRAGKTYINSRLRGQDDSQWFFVLEENVGLSPLVVTEFLKELSIPFEISQLAPPNMHRDIIDNSLMFDSELPVVMASNLSCQLPTTNLDNIANKLTEETGRLSSSLTRAELASEIQRAKQEYGYNYELVVPTALYAHPSQLQYYFLMPIFRAPHGKGNSSMALLLAPNESNGKIGGYNVAGLMSMDTAIPLARMFGRLNSTWQQMYLGLQVGE